MKQAICRGRYGIIRAEGDQGTGNWKAWKKGMDLIFEAAHDWKQSLNGVDYPWLCWNIDDEWCKLQQKLVALTGWVPVVGKDTNIEKPTILPGSVFVDFNKYFQLPVMQMQFPLEFAFLFAKRLAYWHSDFIASVADMIKFSEIFKKLKDGEMAVTWTLRGLFGFKFRKQNRIFELIGCTTERASREQFELGCGWWRNTHFHPNFNTAKFKKAPYYDHGTGITIWATKFGGKVIDLDPDERRGHASNYLLKNQPKKADHRSKVEDMNEYYDLEEMATNLGISHLLE
ncbi:MAG: hypothetical protein JRI36_05450 [Deltaproteobacteria bacterium]|nr:hypothetical protein [Deltaproteobacteria bacterium]